MFLSDLRLWTSVVLVCVSFVVMLPARAGGGATDSACVCGITCWNVNHFFDRLFSVRHDGA